MSYNLAKSIIGNEIIGSCVKHDLVNSEDNILKRPIRIRLKNRSHGRTGRWSEAFVNTEIEKMEKEGCKVFEDERFPECKEEFNNNCIKCQFGKNYIKNDVDIKRFNEVLDNEFPFEE